MHHSKFVNTKAYQKANSKKDNLQFPIFGNSNANVSYQRVQRPEPIRVELAKTESVEPPAPVDQKIHGSVNFEELQKIEDLHKVDEDWLGFFLGKKTAEELVISTSTELMTCTSFAEVDTIQCEAIIPPAPALPESVNEENEESNLPKESLDKIFAEMISDDYFFSRNSPT